MRNTNSFIFHLVTQVKGPGPDIGTRTPLFKSGLYCRSSRGVGLLESKEGFYVVIDTIRLSIL